MDPISNGHHVGPACPACVGTGWTCATCGRNGADCTCGDAAEEHDCQACKGTQHDDSCEECV